MKAGPFAPSAHDGATPQFKTIERAFHVPSDHKTRRRFPAKNWHRNIASGPKKRVGAAGGTRT